MDSHRRCAKALRSQSRNLNFVLSIAHLPHSQPRAFTGEWRMLSRDIECGFVDC